jgi:hypothetical protein
MPILVASQRKIRRALWVTGLLGPAICSMALAQSTPDTTTVPAAPANPARTAMGLRVPLTAPHAPPPAEQKAGAPKSVAPEPATSHRNSGLNEKARIHYASVWGVDKLRASYTSSGNLIRFTYRVLQPKLAAPLGDHASTPELVGIRSNAVLHVPVMEKMGQLRQMSAAESGKEYWMVFSNKGNLVRPGDEVSVIIGKFRADGLVVE